MISPRRVAVVSAFVAGGVLTGAGVYLGLVTAAVPVDLGVGRRTRALGPLTVRIAAPREVVYGVIAAPYADRTTRALREKVRVLERGTDMVLAAHYTPIRGRLHATTVETVRFARPETSRLPAGPGPGAVCRRVVRAGRRRRRHRARLHR